MKHRDVTLEKPLPANVEAERLILGVILLDNGMLEQAQETLVLSDLTLDTHKRIYAQMLALSDAGHAIDPLTLQEELRRSGELERVGGPAYIAQLFDGVPRFSDLRDYVRLVKDTAKERQLILLGNAIMSRAFDGEMTVDDQLRQAEHDLLSINDERAEGHWRDISGVACDVLAEAEERAQSGRQVLDFATGFADLDYITEGFERQTMVVIAAAPKMGKAQPLWATVRTPDGWKHIGDIAVGDVVSGPDGATASVVGVYPQGKKDVLKVTFNDGRVAYCCPEHLWKVYCKDWGRYAAPYRVVTAEQIAEMLRMKSYQGRLKIPLCGVQDGPQVDCFIHPYVLGVLLGDGGITRSVRLTSADTEIVDNVQRRLHPDYIVNKTSAIEYQIVKRDPQWQKNFTREGGNLYAEELKSLGLLGAGSSTKFIPALYQQASYEQRLDLLRGLLDTDGTVEPSGTIRFSTVSGQLAVDAQSLVWSLGGICKISQKHTHYRNAKGERQEGQIAFILSIRHPNDEILFLLTRKKSKLSTTSKNRGRLKLTIRSVEPYSHEDCQCIRVSRLDGLYITDGFIVTHNTGFALSLTRKMSEAEENRAPDGRAPVIGWFSMEMSKKQQARRLISNIAGIDLRRLRSGNLTKDEWREAAAATQQMAGWRVHFDDRTGLTPRAMRAGVRRLVREEGRLDVLFVDYLQLGDGEKQKGETRENEVARISKALLQIAKDYNCTVIVLSQLNREIFKRADKRPNLGDLRDSGQIAQDAHIVIGLHREEVYNPATDKKGIAELILLAQREGPLGTVEVVCKPHVMQFDDYRSEYARYE